MGPWRLCGRASAFSIYTVFIYVNILLRDYSIVDASVFTSDDKILTVHRDVVVPVGRSVYLTTDQLQIRVNASDRCEVKVIDNDPLSQRPGRLTPSVFLCNFAQQEVVYTHFGAANPRHDAVRLLIRYDSFSETTFIPFTLRVSVSITPLEVVTRNLPLNVDKALGVSTPITVNTTEFNYIRGQEQCRVSLLPLTSGQPRYGVIMDDTAKLQTVDCEEFLKQNIRYKHVTQANSPNKDFIPLVVSLLDSTGKLIKSEHFQVMVRIAGGKENEKPVHDVGSKLNLEVTQLLLTALQPEILSAKDAETPSDLLIFNITKPIPSGEGYFINTDNRHQKVTSFHQRDVRELKIAYVPPSVDLGVSKVQYISMQVVDGDGAVSEPFTVKINVRPVNPLGPKINNNKGLMIFEGKSIHLALESNFQIVDANNLEKVKISVSAGLKHGQLTIPDNRQFFTPSDLRSGLIVYQHDDSDSFSDNIIFRVADGDFSTQFLFPVWVLAEDDEPPVLTVNAGLEISKNDLVKITPLILSASDSDSDNTQVRFVLETPYSGEGVILKRQVQTPDNPEDWKLVDGMFEQSVDEFTQSDVVGGLVYYKHVGPHRTEIIIDRIRFHIADSGDPPNQSDVKEFLVKIEPVDDQLPYLFYNTSLQMDVVGYETTYLKRKVMRYADDDSDDRDIKFHVTSPPVDTDVNTRMDAGTITACKDPSVALKTFTQGQVNNQEVCYHPPSEDFGITPRIIQFLFDVEDANGNMLKDQKFTLMVQPMTHSPPDIKNAGLSVVEGDSATLTPDVFDAEEPDSSEENIAFVIMDPPRHGQLKLRGDPMDKGDTFGRKHIRDGNVVYTNNGETVGDDKIMIDVTDGVHHIPVKLNVKVKGLADERPPMIGGKSDILKVVLEVPETGVVTLTADNLKGVDLGGSKATFLLERAPLDGVVVMREKQSTEFSQADILAGVISYRHIGGEVGLTGRGDHFQIAIINPKKALTLDGRKISKLLVEVKIIPVDNQIPIVTVGSPFEVPESKKAPILTRHVDATDVDSEDGDILCLVTLQPKSGYLENSSPGPGSDKSRTGAPISSFTIRDIRSGLISYVQSVHKGSEPLRDSLTFYCTDGINPSPHYGLDIRILPYNDEAPEVTLREFLVVEGGNMRIDLQILNVLDQDVPSDKLAFIITAPPRHGKIVRQTRQGSFTIPSFSLEDITGESTIAYEHDDSETTVDSFTFTLTDGSHNISKTVPINVFPLDDVAPRLATNTGLQITAGEAKKITNKILKVDDLDSNNADLLYYVRLKPKYGYLRRIDGGTITNITQGDKFTQKDIDKRRIEYVHTEREGVRDLIKFDITDGLNSLIDRFFYVTVEGVETATPKVYNKGIQLPGDGVVILTTDLLSETDLNTADGDLTFTVTRTPSQGQLELTRRPGIPVSGFTLQQLDAKSVRYVYNSDDELKMDSFEFESTDGQTPVTSTFRISVSDSSNRKPVLMFQTLRVKTGDNRLITLTELKADDLDTDQAHVVFTVTEVPKRGVLLYNMTRVLSSFTMADISDNMLSYQHDGSQAKEDSFSFTVTDGSHQDFFVYPDTDTTHKPQTMIVNIVADDNGVPQININKGASYLTKLAGGHLGFRISSRVLNMEDREIPEDNLIYSLTSAPKWGYVINRAIGNRSITTWSQGETNRQLIEYILRPGVNATSDSFYFTISDKGGNILVSQPFHLNWAWLSLESDSYVVNETEPTLNVTIRRRGYLGEIAFVSITVVGRSAKSGEDFAARYAKQIQFSPGQTEKTWRLKIQDDHQYEDLETLEIKLSDPVSAVLEAPESAQVTIRDFEDESQIFFTDREYRVAEDYGEILIPIKRIGDFSGETSAVCSTVQGSASGTFPATMTSSDYIPRPLDHTSIVRFERGEQESYCRVVVIDDNLFEDEETFTVLLSDPVGGKLGKISSIQIVIEPDVNDVPVFYHASPEYIVDESDGFVELQIWRGGSDLSKSSSVTVRSRKSDPKSADAGQDYIAINNVLDFGPGETVQSVRVVIIDDVGKPRLEGLESFLVQLRGPVNGVLGEPQSTLVIINDTVSDLPSMQFKEVTYNVRENDKEVRAIIIRSGDINHESSVKCSTRQGSAKPGEDYVERLETDDSVIVFNSGDYAKECVVKLIDNFLFEDSKHFQLVLTSPQSASLKAAKIGQQNSTTVTIGDEDDYPLIKLSDTRYTVKEPMFKEEKSYLKIPVLREGDLSQTAIVSINTKDSSATAGVDYSGFFKELVFGTNVSRLEVEVDILYDGQKEAREMFTVHLSSRSGIVKIENSKATVFIEERNKVADVTFPDIPIVMSLRDYDRPESADEKPIQGYPLVCVTPCNLKHPNYENSRPQCDGQGIDDTLTLFRWRATTLTQTGAVSTEVQDIEFSTFFTSTKSITLDSVYFTGGSKVQCGARAVNQEGDPGIEQLSNLKTIHPESGICEPRSMDSISAEPFRAKIKYTSHNNPKHPKKVKMTITIPHRDGMLPVFSPQPIIDFDGALSKDGTKVTNQMCSNLHDFKEAPTEYGFLSNGTQNRMISGDTLPYQHSARMRSEQTLKFYKNLDLKSCLWTFESYFDLSDLITQCGGEIKVEGQGVNTKQSYLSFNIPLHLYYVFHSPVNDKNWIHFDVESKLQLSFVYDTPMLWEKGISSRDGANGLQGSLYPLSIMYREDGRLVVSFLTEARFNGQFVMSHVDATYKSVVSSPDHPDIIFYLELVQHEQSEQEWSFISELTGLRDFSGTYIVQLIPCIVSLDPKFNPPNGCSPQAPVTFELPIRIRQVSDPVAAKYSLNTNFYLTRRRDLWLSDNDLVIKDALNDAFSPFDKIYGRIDVDPVQNLGHSYDLSIEKLFLCSGKNGHIPKYDPDNGEYGCLAKSPNLQYNFKILDKGSPTGVDTKFGDVPFKTTPASEDSKALELFRRVGADGFSLDCQPVYLVDPGRQWFLQAIFTVRSLRNSGRGTWKRSTPGTDTLHMMEAHREKREGDDTLGVGMEGKGTNLIRIQLDYINSNWLDAQLDASISSDTEIPLLPIIIAVVALILIVCVIIVVLFIRQKRKSSSPPPSPTSTITIIKNGHSKVITTTQHYKGTAEV